MSLEPNKVIERSVDSVARIYAIVIGLALSQSVKSLVTRDVHGTADLSPDKLLAGTPALVAFLFTVVPFWHGMNRHLDRCYLEKTGAVAQGALLFDFAVFFLEATLLFIASWSLRSGLVTFYCLGIVLAADMVWGFISHQIHFPGQKSHVASWATINIVAGFVAILVIAFPFNQKPWVLMFIAIARSIVDYWRGWQFYFPSAGADIKSQLQDQP
jgi:hypothetical protein